MTVQSELFSYLQLKPGMMGVDCDITEGSEREEKR
jgi:hypothetical protein